MLKIHLDTDIGGDMDDLCALAMLLKWPDLEITGVTTVSEEQGRRAGYVGYVLSLMDRGDTPFAAGADVAAGYYRYELDYPPEAENWPEPITPQPGSPEKAIDLLKRSIEQGAVIVGTGPFTNLRLLEEQHPGILQQANLFLMGGHVYDVTAGYPQWGNDVDYNIQVDVPSAHAVLTHANPTLVPLTVSAQTALRRAYLPHLAQAGRLGELIARQAEVCAKYERNEQLHGATCANLPNDIINFQHDPLACAIALGWSEGVDVATIPLTYTIQDGWLHETPASDGVPTRVVTKIDGDAFNEFWYSLLCH